MEQSSRSSSFVILYSITIFIISCGFLFQSSYAIEACYTKEMSYSNSQGERRTEYYTSCNHGSGPAPHTGGDPPSPSHPHGPITRPGPVVPPAPILRPNPLAPPTPILRPGPLFPPTPILRPRPLFMYPPPVFRPGPIFPPPAPAFPGGN